jgi:hypothetical protein
MKRLLLAIALLFAAVPAQAFWLHSPGGGPIQAACPSGSPTPDGAAINAPTACTIANTVGTFSFGSLDQDDTFNYSLLLGGSQVQWSGNPSMGADASGISAENNQSGKFFLERHLPDTKICTVSPNESLPSSTLWFWYITTYQYERDNFGEVSAPSASLPANPWFQNNPTGDAASYEWSLADAAYWAQANAVIHIPAVSGIPYWDDAFANGPGSGGYTVNADAGAKVYCLAYGGKGVFDLGGGGAGTTITINGNASTPLDIGHARGGQYGNLDSGIHFEDGIGTGTVNISNVTVHDDDDCILGDVYGAYTLTNVGIYNCAYNGGSSGWGLTHNSYFSEDPTVVSNEDSVSFTWNGGYSINSNGEGNCCGNSGMLIKDRTKTSTIENIYIGCNWSYSGGVGGDNANHGCETHYPLDFPCGGAHTVENATLEIPYGTDGTGQGGNWTSDEAPYLVAAAEEMVNSAHSSDNCFPNHAVTGTAMTSGTLSGIATDPRILGVSVGDRLMCRVFSSHCAGNTIGTITSITGSGPYSIVSDGSYSQAGSDTYQAGGTISFTGTISGGESTIDITSQLDPTQAQVSKGWQVQGSCLPSPALVTSYTTTSITVNQSASGSCTSFTVERQHYVNLTACNIIDDTGNANVGINSPDSASFDPVTVSDCNIVTAQTSTIFGAGGGATNGGGNTFYTSRAAAATALGWCTTLPYDQWNNPCSVADGATSTAAYPYMPPHL